ncbi:HAD family hydrolase [Xinfangfangia pollutisoli]|uniref:HAD family hydrolase n=1 Tax=Xinfangfangia pollutisoli TaxID=2865960 RepID=UPI001CD62898|nr:HAD family phosphatase [Xinfangfangia pollutisoli]
MYDALLFDLDGTLIDTESLALRTGLAAFAEAGHPVGPDLLHRLVGRDEPSSVAILRAALPATADLPRIRDIWNRGFSDAIAQGLPLKPGVTELLAATTGQRRAIVTSTRRAGAHQKLQIAGLAPQFELVISLDDVTAAKPAPDPYLLAAERLGLSPARCLVFEDSDTGAESARRAGCTVVQIPDVGEISGRFAHHLADDLLSGARMAGLLR